MNLLATPLINSFHQFLLFLLTARTKDAKNSPTWVPDDRLQRPLPHAVIPLLIQGLNTYMRLAHEWQELVKVGPNMTKAMLTGKIEGKKKRNRALKRCFSLEEGAAGGTWQGATSSQGCQEEAELLTGAHLSQHSTRTVLQVCPPEAQPDASRQQSGHHCMPLLSHTAGVH